jgi:transposase
MIEIIMFVRINRTPNSPRKSIQIVESVRSGDKVKQKIVRYVGVAMSDYEEGRLVALANDIIAEIEKERAAPELFDNLEKPQLGRKKRKQLSDILPPDQVALTDVREESRIIEGVDDIAGCAYDELDFNNILQQGPNKLLKDLVLARLVFPESKHKLQQILSKQFDKKYDLSRIYRLMDKIYTKIPQIKNLVANKTQSLMPDADVVLFDVTTLHLESINIDGLREFGYSKDFRVNTTQVVLALATNEHGLPLGYELFEGSMAEVKTLLKSLDKWKANFNIKSVCFVADRAMFSKANLTMLDASGYEYVVAAKLRSLSEEMQQHILDKAHYHLEQIQDDVMWTGMFDYKIDLLTKFNEEFMSFTAEENNQLRDIYAVMSIHNDKFASEFKDNLLAKLRYKKLTLSKEFKDKLLTNKIFISGASSSKLIVSYRSARAKHDKTKREIALKRLTNKTGNAEQIINPGARKYLSINTTKYHFINDMPDLKNCLAELIEPDNMSVAFVVSDTQVFLNKPSKLKHIVVLSEKLYGDAVALLPNLVSTSLSLHEGLTKAIKGKINNYDIKSTKRNLNRIFKDYTIDAVSYVDHSKVTKDELWDGMHGVVTNIKNKSSSEIITKYRNLWRIEEAFRINKHNLKMRPIYHWNSKRIHAHIAICYMAFAILKLIQYKVALTQPRYSIANIMETMISVQSSIHVHKKTKDKYKIPGNMSHEASALYKAFGIHRSLDASIHL